MFNIGFSEFVLLAIIIIVFVDPRKLPGIARYLGRLIVEFKKFSREVRLSSLVDPANFEDPIKPKNPNSNPNPNPNRMTLTPQKPGFPQQGSPTVQQPASSVRAESTENAVDPEEVDEKKEPHKS